ncbi:unnamed protein product [Ambrosiozyma monospora]|uniref:Unnamed protein product n=1 Tax=Ambrosiozyma monospora TaxID=43982 RepID=A0ACB5T7N8_AMBMO|nr:unnamed protein product [Ambrosiozyma monospora]
MNTHLPQAAALTPFQQQQQQIPGLNVNSVQPFSGLLNKQHNSPSLSHTVSANLNPLINNNNTSSNVTSSIENLLAFNYMFPNSNSNSTQDLLSHAMAAAAAANTTNSGPGTPGAIQFQGIQNLLNMPSTSTLNSNFKTGSSNSNQNNLTPPIEQISLPLLQQQQQLQLQLQQQQQQQQLQQQQKQNSATSAIEQNFQLSETLSDMIGILCTKRNPLSTSPVTFYHLIQSNINNGSFSVKPGLSPMEEVVLLDVYFSQVVPFLTIGGCGGGLYGSATSGASKFNATENIGTVNTATTGQQRQSLQAHPQIDGGMNIDRNQNNEMINDGSDSEYALLNDIPKLFQSSLALKYAVLALSARYLEKTSSNNNTGTRPNRINSSSNSFYNYATFQLLHELEAVDSSPVVPITSSSSNNGSTTSIANINEPVVLITCLLLLYFEIMSTDPKEWRNRISNFGLYLKLARVNASSELALQRTVFWGFVRKIMIEEDRSQEDPVQMVVLKVILIMMEHLQITTTKTS